MSQTSQHAPKDTPHRRIRWLLECLANDDAVDSLLSAMPKGRPCLSVLKQTDTDRELGYAPYTREEVEAVAAFVARRHGLRFSGLSEGPGPVWRVVFELPPA
jgi:hypothetical protein